MDNTRIFSFCKLIAREAKKNLWSVFRRLHGGLSLKLVPLWFPVLLHGEDFEEFFCIEVRNSEGIDC